MTAPSGVPGASPGRATGGPRVGSAHNIRRVIIDSDQIPSDALRGIKVINMAVNVPGPLAAARLRAYGAEVVKIEPPQGDPLGAIGDSWYREMVGDSEVLTIDAKSGGGRDRIHAMLDAADVLITSMRPSALARIGLDSAVEAHPHLCHVEIVGDSDDPEVPGHDLTYQAAAGVLSPPTMPKVLVADLMGTERAVSAAMALLVRRGRKGVGGMARVGLRQAAEAASAPARHGFTGEGGLLGGGLPSYGLYEVEDGWVAVAALEPHFLARLTDLTGATDAESLSAYLRSRKRATVARWAMDHDLPIASVE